MHTTGRRPRAASPAASVTACCSAMPASCTRGSAPQPVSAEPSSIAGVTTTTRGSRSIARPAPPRPPRQVGCPPAPDQLPVAHLVRAHRVAAPWRMSASASASPGPFGPHVDHDRPAAAARLGQCRQELEGCCRFRARSRIDGRNCRGIAT